MSLKLGNTTVGSLYLGSTKIGAAYLGSTKVYESTPPAAPRFLLSLSVEWGSGSGPSPESPYQVSICGMSYPAVSGEFYKGTGEDLVQLDSTALGYINSTSGNPPPTYNFEDIGGYLDLELQGSSAPSSISWSVYNGYVQDITVNYMLQNLDTGDEYYGYYTQQAGHTETVQLT